MPTSDFVALTSVIIWSIRSVIVTALRNDSPITRALAQRLRSQR